MTIEIDIQYATDKKGIPGPAKIRKWARLGLADIREEAVMTIRIVDNSESAALNKAWRGKNKATNVLSFPAGDNPLMPELFGDLALCAKVISSEAKQQGKTLDAHWAHMIIHGILHLAGYDHIKPREARKMEAVEISKLQSLKFPNPYE
jgi:probable rRNA maturation factor